MPQKFFFSFSSRYNKSDMTARIVDAVGGMNEAVERLRAGLLVAFPTETVYGLGADARNPDAVARIFAAKGRPATNPLIVHVADTEGAKAVAASWPPVAGTLAGTFWPGPLTLVLPVGAGIARAVTAGGATVGVRVPDHPVALDLLQRSGLALAAPSANRSEEVSPTTAAHVAESLGPWVDDLLILDGGPCAVGIESTVLDVTVTPPRLLRPGMISAFVLRKYVPDLHEGNTVDAKLNQTVRSPGQMLRHYAPRAPVVLVGDIETAPIEAGDGALYCADRFAQLQGNIIPVPLPGGGFYFRAALPNNPQGYAQNLYHALRALDESGVTRIVVQIPPTEMGIGTPPPDSEWDGVRDRLRRAATPKGEAAS